MYQELEELLSVSISKNKPHFVLFQANIYIFTFGAFSSGNIAVLETHPIRSDLGGNGNGIIVRSKSSVALWQLNYELLCRNHSLHYVMTNVMTSTLFQNCSYPSKIILKTLYM